MSYTPPQIPQTLPVVTPRMAQMLRAIQDNVMLNLNCHAIATIQSFKQAVGPEGTPNGLYTVEATINYSKTYFRRNADNTISAHQEPYPTLVDVPAIIMGGGSTYLQFPISKGDQCLILFNDRDLNNWFAGAQSGPVATARTHSLADGLALVGFAPVASFDSAHALLSNGDAQVGVPTDAASALVRIANNTTTLNTVLQELVARIQNIVITGTTLSPTSIAALTVTANKIAALLE